MKPAPPAKLSQSSDNDWKSVKGVCLDIDDTLSTHGKLTARAYAALERLKDTGLAVVPITGRPAGWCDHIARFWPVDGVVGENGGFSFWMEGGKLRRTETPMGLSLDEVLQKRAELKKSLEKSISDLSWASDQAYRERDLAIDFCEDVAPWTEEQIAQLETLLEKLGAHFKRSSIHVNAWYGDYDKLKGFEYFLKSSGGTLPSIHDWVFLGDSPNDEPMFQAFDRSVGVANLKKFMPMLQYPPRWMTEAESGDGFVEWVEHFLSARK